MRISDWSSDVCSSDLARGIAEPRSRAGARRRHARHRDGPLRVLLSGSAAATDRCGTGQTRALLDRKSVVEGKGVSERVDLGGRRIIKKKKRSKVTIRVY